MPMTNLYLLNLNLWLNPEVDRAIASAGGQSAVQSGISTGLQSLLEELHYPGQWLPSLHSAGEAPGGAVFLRAELNGRTFTSQASIEQKVLSAVWQRFLYPEEAAETVASLFVKRIRQDREIGIREVTQYLTFLSKAVLLSDLSALVTPELVHAYEQQLREPKDEAGSGANPVFQPGWVKKTLETTLSLLLALPSMETLRNVQPEDEPVSVESLIESIIKVMLPPTLGVQAGRALLRSYTLGRAAAQTTPVDALPDNAASSGTITAFTVMEQQFYSETGLTLLPLQFEVVERETISFRINQVQTPSWPAIPAGQALVALPRSVLSTLGIEGEAVIHPVTGADACLVLEERAAELASSGALVWSGLEYMALCFKSDLHTYRRCLVHSNAYEQWMQTLQLTFPDLGKAINEFFPSSSQKAVIVHSLRQLVEQNVSLMHLPKILEAFLDVQRQGGRQTANGTQDPGELAEYAARRLAEPVIPVSDALPSTDLPEMPPGLERYIESRSLEERMRVLAAKYSDKEIDVFLTVLYISTSGTTVYSEDVMKRIYDFFNTLPITEDMSQAELIQVFDDYLRENPLNNELVTSFTAEVFSDVPNNTDAFSSLLVTKYAAGL